MSDLTGLFERVRALYMRRFEEARADLAASGQDYMLEPELLNSEGEVAREGALNVGVRLDAIILGGSYEKVSIDSDLQLKFEPAAFRLGELEVAVSPFQWDYFQLRTDGPFKAVSRALAAWFDEAFLATSQNSTANDGIQGAAHFISDPETDGDTITCFLDLGTAPVAALMSLLDRLRGAGAARVEVSAP